MRKCFLLPISLKRKKSHFLYTIDGKPLETANSHHSIPWKPHVRWSFFAIFQRTSPEGLHQSRLLFLQTFFFFQILFLPYFNLTWCGDSHAKGKYHTGVKFVFPTRGGGPQGRVSPHFRIFWANVNIHELFLYNVIKLCCWKVGSQ